VVQPSGLPAEEPCSADVQQNAIRMERDRQLAPCRSDGGPCRFMRPGRTTWPAHLPVRSPCCVRRCSRSSTSP
jgi:hypothetical protein